MFRVVGWMSTKTGVAPLFTKAIAVDTKVKDGIMISSPVVIFNKVAMISSPPVAEWVRNNSLDGNTWDSVNRH